MKQWLYRTGRAFQIVGIVAMPSAMWVTQYERNERAALAVFGASIFVFLIGFILVRIASR